MELSETKAMTSCAPAEREAWRKRTGIRTSQLLLTVFCLPVSTTHDSGPWFLSTSQVDMSRSLELGRAVISSQIPSIELWLTTFITVSSQQGGINDVQRLTCSEILELLFSKSVWVSRANGTHMTLEITLNGEPLGHNMEALAQSLIHAPVSTVPNV